MSLFWQSPSAVKLWSFNSWTREILGFYSCIIHTVYIFVCSCVHIQKQRASCVYRVSDDWWAVKDSAKRSSMRFDPAAERQPTLLTSHPEPDSSIDDTHWPAADTCMFQRQYLTTRYDRQMFNMRSYIDGLYIVYRMHETITKNKQEAQLLQR